MSPWSGGQDGATEPPPPTPEALAFRESLGGVFPDHVAIIMDGNGRWAKNRLLPREAGHVRGISSVRKVVRAAREIGLQYLTLYTFSTENWRRPADEVRYLMGFNESLLLRRRDELNDKGVRIRFIGRRDWRVPKRLNNQLNLWVCLPFIDHDRWPLREV